MMGKLFRRFLQPPRTARFGSGREKSSQRETRQPDGRRFRGSNRLNLNPAVHSPHEKAAALTGRRLA